jgi:hypothetical protein
MPDISFTFSFTTSQQAKLKEAMEYVEGQSLTNAAAKAVLRQRVLTFLKQDIKNLLADSRIDNTIDEEIDDLS